MPTLPVYDPANLPPYPEKPHKTGQARVNVDGKSQYLGKYGTVESHALYHLACARKLITGVVPATRELRDEISRVAGHDEPRGKITLPMMTVIALIFFVAMTSGAISHYLTRATIWGMSSQRVVAEKPVLEIENNGVGEKTVGGDNRFPEVRRSVENSLSEMRKDFPDAIPIAVVDKVKSAMEQILEVKSERSQTNGRDVEGINSSSGS